MIPGELGEGEGARHEVVCNVGRAHCDGDLDKRALIASGSPSAGIGTCCFAVLEVWGGCGGITKWCNRMGLETGPIIEIKRGWDLFEDGLFLWLFRLALAGRMWLPSP